jgi:hypothetical protein
MTEMSGKFLCKLWIIQMVIASIYIASHKIDCNTTLSVVTMIWILGSMVGFILSRILVELEKINKREDSRE